MAENTDNLSMGSFSIQDTREMGMGDQKLIEGLFEPETSSVKPEEIKPIIETAEEPKPAEQKLAGKEITVVDENADEKTKAQAAIANFLGDNTESSTTNDDDEPKDDGLEDANSLNQASSAGTQFTALSNDLFNLGVFTKEEGEENITISTPEEFLERFNSEKKKGANEILENFLSQFGPDYRNMFDAIFYKGVNPKDYLGVYNHIVDLAELDLDQEENQVKVMRQVLHDQGFDPEDIETEINRLRNYGDLDSVAARHHKVLVKKDAQRLQQLEAEAEKELQIKAEIKNQYIKNVQNVITDKLKAKEFDGIPLNPKQASELQEFLLVDKWKTPSGKTLTDFDKTILDLERPENHVTKVKYALLLQLLQKDPSLSTIQRAGVSKKTDTLFTEVARQVTRDKTVVAKNNPASPSKWFL